MLPGSAMYAAVSAVYINFVMDLAHHRVSVLNGRVPQHGIQIFSLSYACEKTKRHPFIFCH